MERRSKSSNETSLLYVRGERKRGMVVKIKPKKSSIFGSQRQSLLGNKKSQLAISESMLAIFVFMIIMIMGLIFFNRYTTSSLEADYLENERIRFDGMLTTFPALPEVKCSSLGLEEACIDTLKLIAFKKLAEQEEDYYREQLGYKKITVEKIWPESDETECKRIGDMPACGVWNIYESKPKKEKFATRVINSPISLYFPHTDSYEIGRLHLEWYHEK